MYFYRVLFHGLLNTDECVSCKLALFTRFPSSPSTPVKHLSLRIETGLVAAVMGKSACINSE